MTGVLLELHDGDPHLEVAGTGAADGVAGARVAAGDTGYRVVDRRIGRVEREGERGAAFGERGEPRLVEQQAVREDLAHLEAERPRGRQQIFEVRDE